MTRVDARQLIGWRERVALPDWGIAGVVAKIDTGARTSSLHVEHIRELPSGRLAFDVVLDRSGRFKHVIASPVRVSRVRPSTGQLQHRHVVRTTLELGKVHKVIELSLVSRGDMLCRMLIGRTALERDFLVDASRRYLCGRPTSAAPQTSRADKRRG
ncbi:MAG: RimK/LysX family protein [Polyangiaceae bacterium]|nr:RimK/LysX family protein [Polyangiaceae bacterium]MCW5791006.1 RimK/LysX family protein [Polyangiaceae bacterium]